MTLLLAHGLGDAGDLPVALPTVLYVAAVALVLAAALAARGQPRSDSHQRRRRPRVLTAAAAHPALRGALRAAGVAGLVGVVTIAALGPASAATNPAPPLAYVVAWAALTLLPLLLGDIWPLLNPWRTLAIGMAHLVGDPDDRTTAVVPERWGVWPAVGQLGLVLYVQVIHPHSARVLLLLLVGLTLVQLLGAIRHGQSWFDRADPFEVYASVIARVSPLRRDPADRARPGSWVARPGVLWIVALPIGAHLHDFVVDTPAVHELRGGLGSGALVVADSVALVGIVAVVGAFVRLAVRRVPVLLGAFVPVVVGYVLTHAAGILPTEGQLAVVQLSDPLDRGWDLLGLSDHVVPLEPVPATAVAITVVVLLVAAHVWAVVLGQRLAEVGRDARTAAAVQLPLRAALVASVVGGIAARLIST